MLLTLKPPLLNGISHESVPRPASPPYQNPPSAASTPRTSKISSKYTARYEQMTPAPASHEHASETAHRNLPPPMTMSLPTINQMPNSAAQLHPSQWQHSEESLRLWLPVKVEEDRRKQEEERTRQESLKLDQRKIEQAMLRDSLQAGVPPYMIPLIFTGLGGGNLQCAQHYISQMSTGTSRPPQIPMQAYQQPAPQQQQEEYHQPQHSRHGSQTAPPQPIQHHAPVQGQQAALDVPRDNRMIPPNPYAANRSVPPATARPPVQQTPPSPAQSPYIRVSQPGHSNPTPAALPAQPMTILSRINSAEMHIQQPQMNPGGRPPLPTSSRTSHPQQNASVKQESQQHAQASPSIYFHHWVPPSNPNTPSGKSPNISPNTGHPASHLRSEYQHSPRKRKAQGSHQPAPPPSSHLSESSSTESLPSGPNRPGRRNTGNSRPGNSSLSQSNDMVATNHSDPGRPGGQMNVNTLVSNHERTTSRSSHRDEPNSSSSDHNQHGQIIILGRYRTSRNSRENSIATNGSVGNEASSHRIEENAPKQNATGPQKGHSSNHISYSNGYHHDVSNGVAVDSVPAGALPAPVMDVNHPPGPQPTMVHQN
ncbi:uncharacterized protein CIMG_03411 [Coccidioides immitis RS]|uniref:uncharacterized protein n=1 Tax=Coccidioides immitis (strain RS) TaxID=246410 RepID=UPI0000D86BE3|nr:uncharacterized protein CIMG_03411 [Coccidioides immitis RS]EAS32387.3 hypothetical protein CIMG_03411 [Coccidioides immitis RS]